MNKLLLTVAFVAALGAAPAHAALQVVLDSNASSDTIVDNGPGDSNPASGVIDISNDFLNGVLFNGVATETPSPEEIAISGLTFRSFTPLTRLASFTGSDPITGLSLGIEATVPGFGFVDDRGLENVTGTPELATWAMLALGFGAMLWMTRRSTTARFMSA